MTPQTNQTPISVTATKTMKIQGSESVVWQVVASSTLVLTVTVSFDGGTTFVTWPVINLKTGAIDTDGASVAMAANAVHGLTAPGMTDVLFTFASGSGTLSVVMWGGVLSTALGIPVSSGSGSVTSSVDLLTIGGVALPLDDAAWPVATSVPLPMGFLADETASDSVDEGDIGIGRMTLDRLVRVLSAMDSNSLRAGANNVTPTFTPIAAATSGNNTLVTNSNAGKKIRVYAMSLIAASSVNLYFTGDNSGTVVFGGSTNKIALASNGGFVLPFSSVGWFECAADTDLVMNLSGAIATSGGVVTAEV